MITHHLKHPFFSASGLQNLATKNTLHELIGARLNLKPFSLLEDHELIEQTKNGRFSYTNCAIALYSNSYSLKSMISPENAPFGYLYNQGSEMLSFNVYRRYDDHLFGSINPLTARLDSISVFSRKVLSEIPVSGIYIRFLKLAEYSQLISGNFGFKPAKEEPWLRNAPEEDESLSHSKVSFSNILSPDGSSFTFPKLRRSFNRGNNYLNENGLKYTLVPLSADHLPTAKEIVKTHFEMLEKKGKLVGSSFQDYLGLLNPEILSLKSVTAYIGFLNKLPISIFICETNGCESIAGYAGITLRANHYSRDVLASLDVANDDEETRNPEQGASAMPTYAYARLFMELFKRGYRYFYMGGSETEKIDSWKQKTMGAEKDPTYWAIQTR